MNLLRNKLLTHFIGWATLVGTSLFIPALPFVINPMLYSFMICSVLIGVFYTNYFVLIPRLQFRGKMPTYLLSVLILLVICFMILTVINHYMTDFQVMEDVRSRWRRPDESETNNRKYFRGIPMTFLAFVGILVSTLIRVQEKARHKELEIASVKADLLNQELNFLRSQINPHFLFNALNNIYSLTLNAPKDAGPVILKLSEMLRYIIYDINENRVPLFKEVNHIQNFIELQKIKDPTNDRVRFEYDESNAMVSPMLLTVFVENSFKHGKIEQDKDGWIDISIKVVDGSLEFKCGNSFPGTDSKHSKNHQGIGIKNVRKRLELIYPDKHSLDINKSEKEFNVTLVIELDK